MKYKCLLAENDTIDRDSLEMLLQKIGQLEVVASCSNGMQAAQELTKQQVDIVFSDIDMPELSGLELLQSLQHPPVFIFISSYKEHAAESYNLDVVDFIVKPVMPGRLLRAVNKAIEHIESQRPTLSKELPKTEDASGEFFIRTSDGLVKLLVPDVAYIESFGNFSKIYTTNGKFHITLVNLKNLELQLPSDSFMRIHKQFVINKKNISIINNDTLTITGGYELPLSPLFRQELLDTIIGDKIVERQPKKMSDNQ